MSLFAKPLILGLCALLLVACSDRGHDHTSEHSHDHASGHSHDPADAGDDAPTTGPHRGRLLTDGDVSVEVTIFESGVPPEFHVYVTRAGKPVDPAQVDLTIELSRLGGKIDRFAFTPENDYLKGDGIVTEPHSFDVRVVARIDARIDATIDSARHEWHYETYEGRTVIAPAMAAAAGIETAVAGGGVLRETLSIHGVIRPNDEALRHVVARFPGLIRRVDKRIGDTVRAGDALAVIESNESLQNYTVTAPIDGVVIARRANTGEVAGADALFVIADYATVWADLTLFASDNARVQAGQQVTIASVNAERRSTGALAHVIPGPANPASSGTPTLLARVVLDNAERQWSVGEFVSAEIITGEVEVPLLVANSALQSFRDFTVVFAQVGDTYEVRMLELGRSDGEMTEVLDGLEPGTTYVTSNSYLIKADIEKSGASHDH